MKKDNPILIQSQNIKAELIKHRRWLHSHPELGFEEIETSRYISNYLIDLGIEIKTGITKTGVVGVLRGDLPGNTIGLRADIDALPIEEGYDSEYKSKNSGKMHACGHDTHTAMLLAVAKLLNNNRKKLKGLVKFIFQPAEEYVSGAQAILEKGVLKDPNVDIALALHIDPDIGSGKIGIKEGVIMSSMDEFEIEILGKGGHGSNPQNTIDPIVTGAQIVMAVQTIISRKVSPLEPAVVSICQFIAGTKSNIIPASAFLSGTIRSQDKTVRKIIFEELNRIIGGICSTSGAKCKVKINEQVPVTINDKVLYDDFMKCASDILEKNEIIVLDKPKTYSEDFSLFGNIVPSLYFFLGTGNERKDCEYPLHSPEFRIDEDVLPIGTALFANYCLNRKI